MFVAVAPARLGADVDLEPAALTVHYATDKIDGIAVPRENAAGDTGRLPSRGGLHHFFEPSRIDACVVVQKGNILPSRGARPDVVAGREADVRRVPNDTGARIQALHESRRVVGRRVVDNEH